MQLISSLEQSEEVQPIRYWSRLMVRRLGMLEGVHRELGVSHSQCHVLVELDQDGTLSAGELCERLNLDRSTISRVIASLIESGDVEERSTAVDKRVKPLVLTPKGKQRIRELNGYFNRQVDMALRLLTPDERQVVVTGIALYAQALGKSKQLQELTLRPIEPKDDPEIAKIIRTVMTEFGAVGEGYSIQDPEVSAMSQAYAGERHRYYVVERDGRIIGGGGFGPLNGAPEDVFEVRKMYFMPEARGFGAGKIMLKRLLEDAKELGYRVCYLETLKHMTAARALYERFGFVKRDSPLGSTGHFGCDAWYELELT